MNLIKPKKLKKGDTIAIIGTSGEIDFNKILKAKDFFEENGYKIKLGSNIDKHYRDLAGNENDRLEDLHKSFEDKEVNAIICARGGYGALRLAQKIDYEIIKSNPKIFCGYSDVTILNALFLKKANLITFSGPMAQSDFSQENIDEITVNTFFNTVGSNSVCKIKAKNPEIYNGGVAEGITFGGNLATLASLCGMDFIPDEKFIFFAEDLNEPTYKIDKYFTQLLNIPKFRENTSAIALGDFLDIDDADNLKGLFRELAEELRIPVVKGFPITHAKTKTTVPYGASAKLDNETLKISDFII